MIQKSIIKIGLAAILSLSTLIAQDEFINKKDDVVIVEDEAMKLVNKMQEIKPPTSSIKKDSFDVLESYLYKLGINQGWDNKKNRIVQIASADFTSNDPAYDNDFMELRLMATVQAKLIAKASIIESIRTTASVSDQLEMINNPIRDKFLEDKQKLERKLTFLQNKIKSLDANIDEKEIENLEGVTLNDRLNAFMDGVITKVDNEYSKANVSLNKKEKLSQIKREFRKTNRENRKLLEKADSFNNQLKRKITSGIKTHSDMPLYGASIIAQSESYDKNTKKYSVSLAVIWSSRVHKAAEAALHGKTVKIAKKNQEKLSLHDWLRNSDLSTMTGGRIYIDNEGLMHFIGIAALAYDDQLSTSQRLDSREGSKLLAKKEAILSLGTYLDSKSEVKMVAQVLLGKGNEEKNELAKSVAKKIVSKYENKTFHGLTQLKIKRVIHPISQRKIHVAVFGINQELAKKAIIIESMNYQTQRKDKKYEIYKKQQKENLKDGVKYIEKNKNYNNRNQSYSDNKTKARRSQSGVYMDTNSINAEDW